jgi:hypothetical protein
MAWIETLRDNPGRQTGCGRRARSLFRVAKLRACRGGAGRIYIVGHYRRVRSRHYSLRHTPAIPPPQQISIHPPNAPAAAGSRLGKTAVKKAQENGSRIKVGRIKSVAALGHRSAFEAEAAADAGHQERHQDEAGQIETDGLNAIWPGCSRRCLENRTPMVPTVQMRMPVTKVRSHII